MSLRNLSSSSQRVASSRRSAFTLLEVMLATIIIGLGVLGLSALFAGAAKQQIDTSRLAEGVKLSQSVERTLRERVGPIGAGFAANGSPIPPAPFPSGNPLRDGQYETTTSRGLDLPFVETIWYPLSAYPPKTSVPAWPAHALAPDPNTSLDLDGPLRLYFTVEGPRDVVLYENRLNTQSATPGPTYTGGQAFQNPPLFRVVDYRAAGGGQNDVPFLAGANGREIARLPHGRIEPGSLRIRFEIARQAFDTTNSQYRAMVASRRTVVFDDASFYAEPNDNNLAGPVQTFPGTHPLAAANSLEGLVSGDVSAYIRINRFLNPPDAAVPAVDGRGLIEQFILPLAGDEWVERIVLERHAYRADRLLTLDERVRRNADGLSVTAATVLQQRGRDGSLRTAILAYTAEPLGGPFLTGRSPRFIPPESGAALDDRLLRRRSMRLRFEDTTETAYLVTTTATSPPAYGMSRGDILLIVGDPISPGSPGVISSGEPGSDGVMRVVRAEQRGAEFRLYLDAVPRSDGRALVGRGGSGEPPVQRDVEVWAFQRQVESLEDYIPRPNANPIRVKWKITPLEGRVVGGE